MKAGGFTRAPFGGIDIQTRRDTETFETPGMQHPEGKHGKLILRADKKPPHKSGEAVHKLRGAGQRDIRGLRFGCNVLDRLPQRLIAFRKMTAKGGFDLLKFAKVAGSGRGVRIRERGFLFRGISKAAAHVEAFLAKAVHSYFILLL